MLATWRTVVCVGTRTPPALVHLCSLCFQRHSAFSSARPASKGASQRLDLPDLPLSGESPQLEVLLTWHLWG